MSPDQNLLHDITRTSNARQEQKKSENLIVVKEFKQHKCKARHKQNKSTNDMLLITKMLSS